MNLTAAACHKQFSLNSIRERNSRGISLFNKIPLQRSCIDAFISEEMCSCFKEKELNESDLFKKTGKSFVSIGLQIAQHINNLTESNRFRCAKLFLLKL